MRSDREVADLHHASAKPFARKGVDGEFHLLVQPNVSDVGLGDRRVDLHLREIVHDREQRRRVQRGRHGLADLGEAVDDDAINRRVQRAATQVGPATLERGLADTDLHLSLLELREDLVEVGLRDEVLTREGLGAIGVGADEPVVGLGVEQLVFRLHDRGLVGRGIEAREHIALLHRAVEVDHHLDDPAGNLAAHVGLHDRLELAGGGDRLDDRPPLHRRRLDAWRLLAFRAQVIPPPGGQAPQDEENDDCLANPVTGARHGVICGRKVLHERTRGLAQGFQ